MCLYALYENLYGRARSAVDNGGNRAGLDALWMEAWAMSGLERTVARQALEDVEQGLPRVAHVHFVGCTM